MNIEELKLVLETIRQLSGDASTAAYWYFGLQFAQNIIILVALISALLVIVHKVCKAAGVDQDEMFMRECRDELRIGSRGIFIEEERRATQAAIRKLIQESKQ
jgi:hypothetical protein